MDLLRIIKAFSLKEHFLYGGLFWISVIGISYGCQSLYGYLPAEVQNNLLVGYMYTTAVFVTGVINTSIVFVSKVNENGYNMFCELYADARGIINQFLLGG